MSTKSNPRRGHGRIQDGGPHGSERKRWAIGKTKRSRIEAQRYRSQERDAVTTGKPMPKWRRRFR